MIKTVLTEVSQCCTVLRSGNLLEDRPHLRPVGGISMGKCLNPTLPGMTVCYEHASKDAVAFALKMLAAELDRLRPQS